MKSLLIKSLSLVAVVSFVVWAGINIQEKRIQIEAEFTERAKTICSKSDTKWIKLSGELNIRSCTDFKIIS